MEFYLSIAIFGLLIALGFFAGRMNERRHILNLEQREQSFRDMLVTQTKTFDFGVTSNKPPRLYTGEAVIATDYLKSFQAGLRNIFGGEVRSYQTLLTRARREATLRILEQAKAAGYNAVCNLRLETADVGGNTAARRVAMVAILASATAYEATAPS